MLLIINFAASIAETESNARTNKDVVIMIQNPNNRSSVLPKF